MTSSEYLSELFSEPYRTEGNGLEFVLKTDKNGSIQCSLDDVIFAIIKPEDCSGLCRIYDLTDSDYELIDIDEESAPFVSKYRALWKEFRMAIDGCSSAVYNCTAMDLPVPYESEKGSDIYHYLAEQFIEKLEEITDSENYIEEIEDSDDLSVHMLNDLRDDCSRRGNTLYFERFVDIYKNELGDNSISDYRSQIKCRNHKDSILRDYHDTKNNVAQSKRTHDLATMSNELANASNLNIISVPQDSFYSDTMNLLTTRKNTMLAMFFPKRADLSIFVPQKCHRPLKTG